ncbi:hypothetical protein [Streptomyces sp. NPDC088775]|uniref:hypothetical protein n=1 Tax=Streptomyces sp. NPDC088775 TaxID=3365896 RepID=UPI00380BD672
MSNIESIRERMGQALNVWYLWERSRSMGGPEWAGLCDMGHDWVEGEYLIPEARPNAFTGRQGSDVSVEWCARCGSVQLQPVDAVGTPTRQALLVPNHRT